MSGQPLRLSPTECTCFRLRSAARRVTQIYGRHLAPTGLKISQFSLLGFVCAEGPVAVGRLSELLATDRTTLTRNLGPLLKEGLIERAASGDKRRHELVATSAGRALFKRALPLWSEAEQELRAALGPRLTSDLHETIAQSMDRLAALSG
jgi:DNA-binding MarR family transcriptional regulator